MICGVCMMIYSSWVMSSHGPIWWYCKCDLVNSTFAEHRSYIDGLVQERRNSSASAMELRLSCTNQSICTCTLNSQKRPIARANGQAMGCLLRVFWKELTTLHLKFHFCGSHNTTPGYSRGVRSLKPDDAQVHCITRSWFYCKIVCFGGH